MKSDCFPSYWYKPCPITLCVETESDSYSSFDGTSWTTEATMSLSGFASKLTVSQSGLVVLANYEQEQTTLNRNQYTVTGFDTTTAGERVATVVFGDIVRNFEYYVSEKEVISISILQNPTKTTYTEGQIVDTVGLKVQAEYIDKTTAEVPISSLTITPKRPLTTADSEVVISYVGKSVSYGVVVEEGAFILGDIDGDGVLKITDVMGVYNHMLSGTLVPGEELFIICDFNKSGSLEITDVMSVYNKMLVG